MHKCKCPKCGIEFDRDKIQAVRVSARRYGHATCYPDNKDFVPLPEIEKVDTDYRELTDYIKELYGDKANWTLIGKQLKNLLNKKNDKGENQYTYNNIKKTLEYFFEIKGNSIEDCHGGIGIVEYAYKDAYNYYLNIWKIQKQNENLNIESFIPKDVSVTILPPQPKKKKKKLFAFLDEEVN